jgi:phage baseplate assembly protein W
VTSEGLTVPAVVEQDDLEDVVNCVEAAMRTDKGSRSDIPTFGISDPTFMMLPVDTNQVIAEVTSHEDRASLVMSETPDKIDSLIDHLTANVGLREERRV